MTGLLFDIVRRYTFSGGQQRFTRFVAVASMLGMVLGVSSLITVMSVMNGFSRELHQRILSAVAHAHVLIPQADAHLVDQVTTRLTADPDIVAASPVIRSNVLLRIGGRTRGAKLLGVDPEAHLGINALDRQMVRGSWEALAEPGFRLVMGQSLARTLGVTVGDRIEVILPTLSVTPVGVFPRRRSLAVIGEFAVGAEPDLTQIYVSLDTAQRLLGGAEVAGVQLRFADLLKSESIAAKLQSELPAGAQIETWRQSQGSLFAAVRMEKMTVALLLLSVVGVAAFNIVSTLTMSVTEKRADIAVLRVLGLSERAVLVLFIAYGMTLGLAGIAAGALLGVVLATNISTIVSWLESVFQFQLFDSAVYYIDALPSELQWGDVGATIGAALLLTVLATIYPATRAAGIPPAEVLRSD